MLLTVIRIGLISDTHIPSAGKQLPDLVAELLWGVDLIIHAGDITVSSVLDWLEGIAPVVAAQGNEDTGLSDRRIAPSLIIQTQWAGIGVMHDLCYADLPVREALGRFFRSPVDVVVHGHTHEPMVERVGGVLVVNPGSASFPNNRRDLPGSVGILTLTPQGARAEIVPILPPAELPPWPAGLPGLMAASPSPRALRPQL